MHPILFHLGSVTIYAFGLFLALGIVAGSFTVAILTKKARIPIHGLFDNILFVLLGGIVGSRVVYAAVYPQFFSAPAGSWTNVFTIWQGGLIFYGAVIGGLIAAWYSFRRDGSLWRWLDIVMIGFYVGVIFGQTGCFLGGCGEGVASSARFTLSGHVPVQFIEALVDLVIVSVGLYAFITQAKWRKGGLIFINGGVLLFASRLLLDYWRPSPVQWKGISGILIADALCLVLFGAIWILHNRSARARGE